MNMRLFDGGYFSPVAEGNIPIPPNSYLRNTTVRQGGDWGWSTPRIPRGSILAKPMPITLNSFSAFSADPANPFAGEINPEPTGIDTSTPINWSDVTRTPAITQPAAVRGNAWSDILSGVIKSGIPVANAAISGTNTSAAMTQFLKGNLPGYQVNPKTGLLQKINTAALPIIMIGGALLVLYLSVKHQRVGKNW